MPACGVAHCISMPSVSGDGVFPFHFMCPRVGTVCFRFILCVPEWGQLFPVVFMPSPTEDGYFLRKTFINLS